jgi:hypothetical protein
LGDPALALPVLGFGRAEVRQRQGLAFLHAALGHAEGDPNRVTL